MGTQRAERMRNIIQELLGNAAQFTFTQVMRLLRRQTKFSADDDGQRQNLLVRPHLGMGHPASDVRSVELIPGAEGADEQYLVTANFQGLYGSGTPLPSFYTEDLFEDEKVGRAAPRAFFDLLNNRLYHLLFRVQCKYRIYWRIFEQSDPVAREMLFSLIGLSPREIRGKHDNNHFLRYASVFLHRPRCSAGLKSLACDVLQSQDVMIEQCCQRQVTIPPRQRIRLGQSNCVLGEDAHVGMFVKDRMGRVRIWSHPLPRMSVQELMPQSPRFERLRMLVQTYIDTPLECEMALRVLPEDVPAATLGGGWSRLGYETWSYSGPRMKDEKRVYFRLS